MTYGRRGRQTYKKPTPAALKAIREMKPALPKDLQGKDKERKLAIALDMIADQAVKIASRSPIDIRGEPDSIKFAAYDKLEKAHHGHITSKEHPSGFPAITVFVNGKPRFITDTLSVEDWERKRTGTKHVVVYAEGLASHGYGTNVKTKAEALKAAAIYFKVPLSTLKSAKTLKVEQDLGHGQWKDITRGSLV
jgi:hypothetical protein